MSRKPKPTKVKRTTAGEQETSAPRLTSFQAYQLAEQHFKAGQWHEAIALCRKILEVAPKYANALHLLGVIAAQTGSLEDAEQWMLKALEYGPNNSHYHNSLANVYRLLNQPELATKHWRHAKHAGYPTWVKNFDTLTPDTIEQMRQALPHWQSPPLISVLMPTYNTKEEWLRAAIESVLNQIYPHWELCIADDASTLPHVRQVLEEYAQRDSRLKVDYRQANGHISAASNSALALAQGDYIALLDHDDVLPPHALYMVAGEIMTHPQVRLIYSDEDKINERGERFSPYFKCDWNPDLFLSHNLITHLGVYKTVLVRELGGFREGYEGAQDYDLALRVVEHLKPHHIRHIPHVLYHWRTHSQSTALTPDAKPYAIAAAKKAVGKYLERSGKNATQVTESFHGPGTLRVRYPLPASPPLVSLIIPTRNRLDLLRICIGSILEKTTYQPFEIIIVDNNSDDPATLSYLQGLPQTSLLPIRVISYPHSFNYAALNNFAVAQSQGELIGLLNNDIEIINDGWLTEMVSHACRPEIGAVGARLWYPNNTLQHGGIILGIGGVAGHSHKHFARGDGGYFGRAQLLQNFSAVTAACLVMRKEVFTAISGFNETDLTIAFNDVDLCLRIREQGWRILWTPYAELYHHESASRGYEDTPEKQTRFAAEIKYMKARWGESLLKDPAYSQNLTLDTEDFAIAWPPRRLPIETLNYLLSLLSTALPTFLKFRQTGYQLLTGHGLEIGALMWPAQVLHRCLVDYCDAQSKADSLKLFPETQSLKLVDVDYISDLDRQGLSSFQTEQFDFVILNQVIEYVANPIQVIAELFRVTKVGGQVVIAAPDKDFTFDKSRALTSFEHLWLEYEDQVKTVTDDHYLDFLLHVHPELELAVATSSEVEKHLRSVRSRREHVHVWDSQTFKAFLMKTLELLNVQANCVFEVTGEENQFENFSVWQKQSTQLSPSYYKALARVLEVSQSTSVHSALWGFSIDSPIRGMSVSVSSLKITGWVLGRAAKVLAVEVTDDALLPSKELLFKTVTPNESRPDVAKVFPEVPQAQNSGFSVAINLPHSFQDMAVKVTALLANQQRIKLAGIKLQRFLVPLSFQPRPDSADKIVNNPNYAGWYNTIHRFLSESFIPQLIVDTPIDIIIPVYNGYDYLTTLLPSVLKNTRLPHRIILFDDASPDPKVVRYLEELRDTYDHIVLIRAAQNLGFIGAVNTAYQQVNNHFVILNQDTEVPEYWLERLMYPIFKYHDIASTTPFTNSGTICSFPTFLEDNPLFKGLTVDQVDKFFQRVNPTHHYVEIPTGVGFCMGINKRVADAIGLFDHDTFGRGYGEENDWCMRAKQAGYQHVMVPNLFVYHKHGGAFSQAERTQLQQENLAKLFHRHPEYPNLVNDFIKRNPLKNLREFLIMLISTHHDERGAVLIIDNLLGGGAKFFSRKLMANLVTAERIVFLISYHSQETCYKLTYTDQQYHFEYRFGHFEELDKLLAICKIGEIHLNQLVSFKAPLDVVLLLVALKRRFNPRLTIYVHDYFMVCPSYNLLNNQGQYCQLPELPECTLCLQNHPGMDGIDLDVDIVIWRNTWGQLLAVADKITCFSNSSKSILTTAYQDLTEHQIVVSPHQVEYISPVKLKPSQKDNLHVGVLGAIGIHKGFNLIKEMLGLIDKENLKVKILVIGYLCEMLDSKNLLVTGEYHREDLPALVEQHQIDIFFQPSICPETFSFTTAEVMMMGLPLAVFDLGAPAERVRNYERGLVIEKMEAGYALEELLKFAENLGS